MEKNFGDSSTLLQLGIQKYEAVELHSALDAFERANAIDPNNAQILKWRGNVRRRLDDFDGALADLNRADELSPNDTFTLSRRADTQRLMEDYDGAREDFDRAYQLDPNDAWMLTTRGLLNYDVENYNGALDDLNRANKLEPNDAVALQYRGDTKRILGDHSGALEDLNKADQLEPNDEFTLQARGDTKRLLGDYKGALEDLNRADELEPDDAFTLRCRGDTKRMLDDLKGALEDLNRAYELDPTDADTLQSRGDTNRLLNNYTGAYIDLNLSDELEPQYSWFTKEKSKVKKALMKGISRKKIKKRKLLGKGGFGEVYLAKWKGKLVALKKPIGLDREKKFSHPNIITPFGFCGKKDNRSLIMEYADGGSLYDLLHKQKVELIHNNIVSYALDVASGLAYLHSRHVIHRDLKSANVLLFEGRTIAKIADFGHSQTLIGRSHASSVVGTLHYVAPEILAEQPYNTSADVYSFGILLHEMCTNTTIPILEEDIRMQRIKANARHTELCDLIMNCCRTDPKLRPTIQECLDTLKQMKTLCATN